MDKGIAMQDMKKRTDTEDSKKKERHIVTWSQEVNFSSYFLSSCFVLFYFLLSFFFFYFVPSLDWIKEVLSVI